jgi:hypothetical protein
MMFRLVLISSAISGVLLASENASKLSPFPDASKSLQQLARESLDRQIAASVQARRAPTISRKLLPQQARAETCSIPLLENKVQHPERFRMQILKIPAKQIDNIATPPPVPVCTGRN